jgi:hypothetical protein
VGIRSEYDSAIWQEKRLEEILFSNISPVAKTQQIVKMGFDQEIAEEIVTRYQIGQHAPVYYERIDGFADDFDDDELEDD